VVLVIYAILTEQNIAKLFLAAFIPGILAAVGYIIVISLYVRLKPGSAGSMPPMPMAERWKATFKVWPVLVIFWRWSAASTPVSSPPPRARPSARSAPGVAAWAAGGLNARTLRDAIYGTAVATGMIFMIVLGAGLYNTFLALSQLPQELAQWVIGLGMSPWLVLTTVLVVYLLLGCVMDSLSMILLTIPIFFPMIMGLDFGMNPEETAIWFGILVLIVVEVGLITPPVGMNLFVINSMAKDTPIVQTYRGVTPFVISDLVRTAILAAFPAITLIALRMTS
jgi:C4-dicarboxylate transporter DctM subunit